MTGMTGETELGEHGDTLDWIPACAGMTGETEHGDILDWIPACAGMTGETELGEHGDILDWIPALSLIHISSAEILPVTNRWPLPSLPRSSPSFCTTTLSLKPAPRRACLGKLGGERFFVQLV